MKKQKQQREFPFGQIVIPENDTIGGYDKESGRMQLCVNEEVLRRLSVHSKAVDWSAWKRGPCVCTKGRRDITRVSKTHHGWRAYHRIYNGRGCRHILGYVLGDLPLLFPTVED